MNKLLLAISVVLGCFLPLAASAHCDTMDGPVVLEAQAAITSGDVTPLLKWVRADDEAALKQAFENTLAVRKLGSQARELADMYFFETLVRVHRASEGAPYTGLKPAGTPVDPAVAAADKALEIGSDADLTRLICQQAQAGLHERFTRARDAGAHAAHNTEAGREYVAAYVDFVHYAEALHQAAARGSATHADAPAAAHEH